MTLATLALFLVAAVALGLLLAGVLTAGRQERVAQIRTEARIGARLAFEEEDLQQQLALVNARRAADGRPPLDERAIQEGAFREEHR